MPDRKQAPPPQTLCGFHRPDRRVVTDADLRSAIVAAAIAERARWFAAATSTVQKEDHDGRFGDLVRYWLGGQNSDVRPGKLEALQQAAVSGAITYGNLTAATLHAGIGVFKAAEARVTAAAAAVYRTSDAADDARIDSDSAASSLKVAHAKFTAAAERVRQAAAAHKTNPTQSSAALLAQERQAWTAAQTALTAAQKVRDDARQKHGAATQAVTTARRDHANAVAARTPLTTAAQRWDAKDRARVRTALLAKAASADAQNVNAQIDTALQLAHQSRADIEAWSAVFVSSCIRSAALALKLEVVNARGIHNGANRLFKASQRHWEYTLDARDRKKRSIAGAYHALEPRDRAVRPADIVITDRNDFIGQPVSLGSLGRTILHGDIVTRIHTVDGVPLYAEAIGGNVAHAVRRRRYPLDRHGKLVVSATTLYAQEDDSGAFGTFQTRTRTPSMLAPASTGRIMALLSPVVECKAVGPEKAGPAGGSGAHELELESPFLDELLVLST